MVGYVFGEAIRDEVLESRPEYAGKEITRLDRARYAMEEKSAQVFVEEVKEAIGEEEGVICAVYNATGDTLTFVRDCPEDYDPYGSSGRRSEEYLYPAVIENGQWGVFFRIMGLLQCQGYVQYRGKNNKDEDRDFLLWWHAMRRIEGRTEYNTDEGYALILKPDDDIVTALDLCTSGERTYTVKEEGCVSTVGMTSGNIPYFEAIVTIEDDDE